MPKTHACTNYRGRRDLSSPLLSCDIYCISYPSFPVSQSWLGTVSRPFAPPNTAHCEVLSAPGPWLTRRIRKTNVPKPVILTLYVAIFPLQRSPRHSPICVTADLPTSFRLSILSLPSSPSRPAPAQSSQSSGVRNSQFTSTCTQLPSLPEIDADDNSINDELIELFPLHHF